MHALTDLLRTTGIVFRTHLVRIPRTRRMLFLLVVALVPTLLVFVSMLGTRFPMTRFVTHTTWWLVLQVLLPTICLIAGSAVVSEEISDRTITFVVTRPVSRAGFLLGRWLATAVWVSVLLATSVAAMTAAAAIANRRAPAELLLLVTGVTILGGLVYTAIFAALGAVFRRAMILGVAYAFALEALLANLPGSNQGMAVQHHLRALIVGWGSPDWQEVRNVNAYAVYEPPTEALQSLLWTLFLALLLGCLVLRRRQIIVSS